MFSTLYLSLSLSLLTPHPHTLLESVFSFLFHVVPCVVLSVWMQLRNLLWLKPLLFIFPSVLIGILAKVVVILVGSLKPHHNPSSIWSGLKPEKLQFPCCQGVTVSIFHQLDACPWSLARRREIMISAEKQVSLMAELHTPLGCRGIVLKATTLTVAAVVVWSPDCKKTYR